MKLNKLVQKATIMVAGLMMALVVGFMVFPTVANAEGDDGSQTAQATEAQITEQTGDSATGSKALAAALVVGLAGAAGAIGMGIAIAKSSEGIARQPEASGEIRSSLMLGLVFIETLVIYALIVTILIVFVM